jgi:hypothetical protein
MRLLIHLAVQPSGVATIHEIAGQYGITRTHLMKVANVRLRPAMSKEYAAGQEDSSFVRQKTGQLSNVSNLRRTGALLSSFVCGISIIRS